MEDALRIEYATGGQVTCEQLLGSNFKELKRIIVKKFNIIHDFSINERVALGISHEEKVGQRRGFRSDLKPRQNFVEVKEEIKEKVSRKEKTAEEIAGFKNRETYRQAKLVVKQGTRELIQAVDNKQISISTAAKLARFSEKEQREILKGNKKDINAYLKKLQQ